MLPIRQLTLWGVIAVWAAAAVPMGVLAWLVAPAGNPEALIGALTAGLAWQCALTLILVRREQRSLRWPILRRALWLTGPARRRQWWWLVPLIAAFGALQLIPSVIPEPADRSMGVWLQSPAGPATLHENWPLWTHSVQSLVLIGIITAIVVRPS